MRKGFVVVLGVIGLAAAACATESDSSRNVPLVPSPKEVRMSMGGFHVGPGTKIFVLLGHQEEDRIAAETLAEQVEEQSGVKLDIVGTKPNSKAEGGAIMLVRLNNSKVRSFLAAKGLTADRAVGQQGYLLFSDNSHLIVAANTGQGLFSGVQTLRQLLRPDGKDLICPAVSIRDWPNLTIDDSVGKGSGSELVMQFRRPGL